jgi:hypothetical protein
MDQVVGQALATFRRIEETLPKVKAKRNRNEAPTSVEVAV